MCGMFIVKHANLLTDNKEFHLILKQKANYKINIKKKTFNR